MAKGTPITERKIRTYQCTNEPGSACIAIIDGWSMVFYGATPFQAMRNADQFRREEVRKDVLRTRAKKAELLGEVEA